MTVWRYYVRGMLLGYAVASAALMSVFFLFDLISEAETVGTGSYSFADAMLVVLMKLPTRFVELSPIVAMLGITYALAVFGRNLELVAIRTTGVSPARLALVSVFSVILLFVVVGVAELGGRPLHKVALSFRMLQVAEQGQPVRGDLWVADPAGMIRISNWGEGMQPRDLELFVFSSGERLERYVKAEHAVLQADGLWVLHGANVVLFGPERIEQQQQAEVTWQPQVYRNLTLFDLPVEGLSLAELAADIRRRRAGQEDFRIALLEFWRRSFLPLSAMVFAGFAAALGLREGERGGVGRRLAIGVVLALVLYLGQQIALNATLVAGLGPVVAVAAPIAVVALLASIMLRRAA